MLIRWRWPWRGETPVWESRAALWLPHGVVLARGRNVLAIRVPATGPRLLVAAANIVTTAGDVHLAQRGAAETPTNAFGIAEMASAGTPGKSATRASFTPISGSQGAWTSGYPRTNDPDPDNPDAGTRVVTRTTSYSAASFTHSAITHALITNASPGGSEPLYAGWAWSASFSKSATDTLKVIHNTLLDGV